MENGKLCMWFMVVLLALLAQTVHAQQDDYSRFTMIISSDPQLVWVCEYCGPGSEEEQGKRSNAWQVGAMHKIDQATSSNGVVVGKWPDVSQLTRGKGSSITKPLGVIINGDLTAYWHDWQKQLYQKYYDTGFQYHVYPGLGNHDYQNNVNSCADSIWGWFKDGYMHCARQATRYIRDDIMEHQRVETFNNFVVQSFDKDSLAYSFEIGNYHFVQLHNKPTYAEKDIPVKSSIAWLENDLKQASARGKRIVINMHLNHLEELSAPINGNNVIAVFVGHRHEFFGYAGVIPNTTVPYFFSGSSQYNRFLLVEFGTDYMNVGTINAGDKTVSFHEESSSVSLKTYLHPAYTPSGSGSYWSPQARGAKESDKKPALTAFNNALHMAWKGNGNGDIYAASFDGYQWSEKLKIPGSSQSGSGEAPALAVYNGKLYCAWIHDENIYLASSADGKSWEMEATLTSMSTRAAPVLAAFNGRLYTAWSGYHDDGVFYASFNGTQWTSQSKIGYSSDKTTDTSPALAAHQGRLYAGWKHDEKIYLASTNNGSDWIAENPMLDMGTKHAPALASYHQKLYAAWNGYRNDGVYYASFDGTNWTSQAKADIPYLENDKACALTTFDGRMYLGMEYYGFRIAHYNVW